MKYFLTLLTIIIMNTVTFCSELYNIKILNNNGEEIILSSFKGKKILFVNVASKCGFTSQYKDLETLFQKYKEKLVIVAIPCNQFGG